MVDKTGKTHIIEKETGFCETCQKFERPPEKASHNYGELLAASRLSQYHYVHELNNTEKNFDFMTEKNSKKLIKYKRYKCCDCCNGKLAAKFKTCKICEALYYVPLWCVISTSLLYTGLITAILYLAASYSISSQLQTYSATCSSTLLCNTDKGLYCRTNNATTQDYCNCPAKSKANSCDCPNSYFWSGISCTPVYTNGNGPCMADFACSKGLTCNQYTGLCSCPDLMSTWDDTSKSCTYSYKGCFTSCFTTTSCDFYQNDVLLVGNQSGQYSMELDECLNICNLNKFKYAHLQYSSSVYRCACSSSYNKYSTQLADSECNIPCSSFKSSVSRCPKNNRHSSFQIGS